MIMLYVLANYTFLSKHLKLPLSLKKAYDNDAEVVNNHVFLPGNIKGNV